MMYMPDGLQHVVAGGYIHTWSRTLSTCSLDDPPTRQQLQTLWELGQGNGTKDEVGYLWCVPRLAKSQIWHRFRPASRGNHGLGEEEADHVVGQEHFQLPTYTRHPLAWRGMAWEGRDKQQPNRLGEFRRRLVWLRSRTQSQKSQCAAQCRLFSEAGSLE